MKKKAVIVAGGSGQRMGNTIPKQFLLLKNKPVLWYTLDSFLRAFPDLDIILVLPADHEPSGKQVAAMFNEPGRFSFVQGGASRFHSVQCGLQLVQDASVVFVHDAVRCLVSVPLIQRCYRQAVEKGSAIPAVASTDSIRLMNTKGHAAVDRQRARIVQTPQTFQSNLILPAFKQPYQESFTDEATVVEAFGTPVHLTEGEYENIKITRPIDMIVAEAILEGRSMLQPTQG